MTARCGNQTADTLVNSSGSGGGDGGGDGGQLKMKVGQISGVK